MSGGRAKIAAARRAPSVQTPDPPWERQPGEPDVAWESFAIYRDLGPGKRSLAELGRITSKNRQTFNDMSVKWRWVERTVAWDKEVDRVKREAALQEIRDMEKRHVQLALLKQSLGAKALRKMAAKEDKSLEDPTIELADAARLIDEGVKLERLNRGEPEGIQETRIVPDAAPSVPAVQRAVHDFSKLSKDELRALKSLVGKAR